jgi:uncharacterized protein (DUF433 family)
MLRVIVVRSWLWRPLRAGRAQNHAQNQLEWPSACPYIPGVKNRKQRIELGRYIVADSEICHGKPTFKGTRIMVWQVLDALGRGESPDDIVTAWDGKVSKAAIAETIRLAREALLDEHGRLCCPTERLIAA